MCPPTIAKMTAGPILFEAVINDILYEPSDCVVNAANCGLSHGGGMAAEFLAAAGHQYDEECLAYIKKNGQLPVGSAVPTTSGDLRYRGIKGVVNVVGPRMVQCKDGAECEDKLSATVKNAFLCAQQKQWKSLSFPAISSGLYAVPQDVCARAYVRAVREYAVEQPQTPLRNIRLALFLGHGPGSLPDLVCRAMGCGPAPQEAYRAKGY